MFPMPARQAIPQALRISAGLVGLGSRPSLSALRRFFGPRVSFAGLFSSSPAPVGISRDTSLQTLQAVWAPPA